MSLPPDYTTPLAFVLGGLLPLALGMCRSGPGDDAPSTSTFEEPYRPQFHYTPQANWMNDPNGLVYHDGTYHLFHQYNPKGNTWGHMSWGHATSPDLVHWTHQGVAIEEEGNEMIFSGSAVVDHNNTSSFGADADASPMVAIYTSHYTLPDDSIDQAQSLAYSTDGGATWTKYEGNPVLEHEDPEFRDPNVFWYAPENKWIMAVALSKQRKIQFYASPDLKEWTHLSDFGPTGSRELIWECPALFRVPIEGENETAWVLQVDVNPGSVAGGSGGRYFVGTFDGTTFTPVDENPKEPPRWVDYGPDFYAAIPWNNRPRSQPRPIWAAWMNNWEYAKHIPTSPWRSALTLPRTVHLRRRNGGLQLVQQPIAALEKLRRNHVERSPRPLENETVSLDAQGISGRALELVAVFRPGDADRVGLNVRVGGNEKTVVGYDASEEHVYVDRRASGAHVHDAFPARNAAPLSLNNGRVKLHVLVDWSSVEVFANDGVRVLTHRIFPDSQSTNVSLFASGGRARLVQLDAWALRSIWPEGGATRRSVESESSTRS